MYFCVKLFMYVTLYIKYIKNFKNVKGEKIMLENKNVKNDVKVSEKVSAKKAAPKVSVPKKAVKKAAPKVSVPKKAVKKAAPVMQTSVWCLRSTETGKIAPKVYKSRIEARDAAGKLKKKVTVLKLSVPVK